VQPEYYKTCKELPLRIFFEVAESGKVELLIIKGEVSKADLVKTWENIIEEYSKIDKNMAIRDVIEKKDEMFKQAALYCEIKGMLLYLLGAYKQEYVERLNELGYRINEDDRETFVKSIKTADSRANHISTRLQFLQKDLEKHDTDEKSSFDAVIAWLSSQLGFEVNEDITVLRYLEYKKQIKRRERNSKKRFNN
jgi:hypothetical protein